MTTLVLTWTKTWKDTLKLLARGTGHTGNNWPWESKRQEGNADCHLDPAAISQGQMLSWWCWCNYTSLQQLRICPSVFIIFMDKIFLTQSEKNLCQPLALDWLSSNMDIGACLNIVSRPIIKFLVVSTLGKGLSFIICLFNVQYNLKQFLLGPLSIAFLLFVLTINNTNI